MERGCTLTVLVTHATTDSRTTGSALAAGTARSARDSAAHGAGRCQLTVAGGRPAGRARRSALAALAAAGEIRKAVAPRLTAAVARAVRRIRRVAGAAAQRPRRQCRGHVEGTGTAAVAGSHGPGTARAGQPRAVGAAGPGATGPGRITGTGARGRT
ncbi:hypothetical protein E4K73_15460 [Streptomyces sp. IB201691-2A2]|nr:hypothetical protein E4K73_15460 [Streptomyces sp. IB201691-2A2]